MAVQMDKPSELSSRERAQHLYNKNVELESTRRKSAHARIPSDPNVWQQIRENYEAIILEDHSFSEQHEIELALWQLHYRRIEELRAHFSAALSSNTSSGTQNGKGGPARPDRLTRIRSQFRTFLSEATGFYHELMLKIRAKYGLPLGYFSDDPETQIFLSKDGQRSMDIKKGLISCHRCLIYLGDLARYKGLYGDGESKTRDFAAASSYYMQASSLWPPSGNPHHQLAIVAAYSSDEFVAIYRYFRSLAVENPFSTARDNLIIAFERNRQNYSQLLGECKTPAVKAAAPRMTGKGRGRGEGRPSSKDNRNRSNPNKESAPCIPDIFKAFCVKFIRVNGILFTRTSLETFVDVLSMAKKDFMILLSSGENEKYSFGSDATECGLFIIRLVAILIFTVHNVNRESENQSYAEILQRSVLLQNAYTATFEFMGHVVERCLQLQDPLSSYLLPGVLMFMEWLACHPDVAAGSEAIENQDHVRLFFWSSCISFLNRLLSSGFYSDGEDETCFFNMSKYEDGETANRFALWEDFELRGFLPLHPAQQILDFSRKHHFGSDGGLKEKRIRVQRTIAAGKVFANVVRIREQGIYFDSVTKKFILGTESQLSTDLAVSSGPVLGVIKDTIQELSDGKRTNLVVQRSSVHQVEEEDEEEVIVFKPSVADKQADGGFPALLSAGDLGLVASMSDEDLDVHSRSVPASENGNLPQNGFDTTLKPATFIDSATTQHLQPIQPNISAWLGEQKASMMNEFKNFSLIDNGHLMNQKPPQCFATAALSLPFSSSVNLSTCNVYPAEVPKDVMPLTNDFNMFSGPDSDICIAKSQSLFPVGSRKSPVSRPARHVGPPPGFTPFAPKYAEVPQRVQSMKEENPLMDDYSWLDGYQMPSSTTQGIGFDISTNLSGPLYNHVSKSNGIPGAISFPFPGKQASAFQAPAESHKLWQDYQFPDHLRLYEQQQMGKQQPMPLPKYQGQSLWEGRFLV